MKKVNSNYLAVIPARGGSKRIPHKNLLDIGGKPLIAYTIEAAINCPSIDRTIVSTDDQEIAEYSSRYGAEIPFLRPHGLSLDDSATLDVLYHAFKKLDSVTDPFSAVILLQPTSIFRTSRNIIEAINLFEESKSDTVTSVCYPDESPYYSWKIKNNRIRPLFPIRYQNMSRQKHPITVMENGAIYIIRREIILKKKIYGETVTPYIMNKFDSTDIDEPIDVLWAKFLINQKKVT